MPIEFGARIADIPAYPIAAGYDLGGDYAMLASNEAPFAPAESVQAAAAKVLGGVNRYPNPAYPDLRRALSEHYGIDPTLISLGNGSCDLLFTAATALLEPGAEFVFAWPSFSEYPRLAAVTGARAVRVPLDDEERHDLDAMAAEITVATRLVIVCNPNNPTSTALDLEAIDAFLAKVPPQCAVILDEAYIEFSQVVGDTHASVPLLAKYPNLIILRTFSKVYGLAGLRVGYGLGSSAEFVMASHQVRQPFFLNAAAQAAAVEALARQDEVQRRVGATIAAREAIVGGLEGLGLWVAASDANFVWVKLSAKAVPVTEQTPVVERGIVAGLHERGVLVRAGSALGRAGFLRVTVGTEPENTRFLGALEDLLG